MSEIFFNGPAGRIEGRYYPANRANAPIALVLHPHPLYGGSMQNKVVHQVGQIFQKHEFSVLRFNFRGVGRSVGEYDHGQGELSDAASALDWLQQINENAPQCWITGFSFGAWIAMQLLMRRPEISGFIGIAPPANNYDFAFLAPCPVSGAIIHGTADQVVPIESVDKLVNKLSSQKNILVDYLKIKGANHFFESHIPELSKHVSDYLGRQVALLEAKQTA